MIAHRIVTDIFPQTSEAQKYVEDYESILKETGSFVERKDSTTSIQIVSEFYYDIPNE